MKEIEIVVTGKESDYIALFDVVNFLFDFNVTYEIGRLATDPSHESFKFSRYIFYRNGRPLEYNERLFLKTLEHGSPTKLVTRLTATSLAVGSIWGCVQIYSKVADHPLEHRKLIAEVRKVELEVQEMEQRQADSATSTESTNHIIAPKLEGDGFERFLYERGALQYFEQATNRLIKSPVRIEDMEIRIVNDS